jgi:hypothetical protein
MEWGKVVVQKGEQTWVRYLYREYNAGATMRVLRDNMQASGAHYGEGKEWNINMIARILSDERYIGADGYPVILDVEVFLSAAERRKKKAPAVQKTEVQKILRKKCGCRVTPHMEHEVLYLLNLLAGKPEQIEIPYISNKDYSRVETMQTELEELLGMLPVDEKQARLKLMETTVAMYEAINPREYETQRLKRIFGGEQMRTKLDANILDQCVSAVTVDSMGRVRVRLKNDQIIERRECNE